VPGVLSSSVGGPASTEGSSESSTPARLPFVSAGGEPRRQNTSVSMVSGPRFCAAQASPIICFTTASRSETSASLSRSPT
jgi:hypothetical protein